MELRHRREALVGVLIIAGAAIFLFLSMWLRGRSFSDRDQVKVVFDDVAGLKEGDPVRTSGVAVGQVRRIALVSPRNVDVWSSLDNAPVPKVGDKAPLVTGKDQDGRTWELANAIGKKIVILYFYPEDDTPGCTKEACGVEAGFPAREDPAAVRR